MVSYDTTLHNSNEWRTVASTVANAPHNSSLEWRVGVKYSF